MITSAEFVISNTDYKKGPAEDKPEFAFIGRSNVGKSSLINMLTNHSKLAKTSGRPGKTQLINHFIINNAWYLVDLPGYGFAKVSKDIKSKWDKMIKDYLTNRKNLLCTFILIDSRLEPQKVDLEFIDWVGQSGVPICLIFTKADKQSLNKTQATIAQMKKALLKSWEEMPQYFITSAENKTGREEVLNFIAEVSESFEPKRF